MHRLTCANQTSLLSVLNYILPYVYFFGQLYFSQPSTPEDHVQDLFGIE